MHIYKKLFLIVCLIFFATQVDAKQKKQLTQTNKRTSYKSISADQEIKELNKILKEKQALNSELKQIRQAQYLTIDKSLSTEPLETKNLSQQTAIVVPAPEATVTKEVKSDDSNSSTDFAAAVENSTSKSLKSPMDPIYNNFKTIVKYNITDIWNLKTEPSIVWKWTKNTDDSSAFIFNDWPITLNNTSFHYSESMMTTFSGSLVLSLPTSKWARQAGVISTVIANVVSKTDINNYKGSLTITPEIAYVFRKYTTSTPKGVDNVDPGQRIEIGGGDELYEILTPYNQFTTSVNTSFWHKLVGDLSATIWFKFINTRMYGDYAYNSNGMLQTITPATWINVFEFAQELKYQVSNKFNVKLGISSIGNLSGYRPFNTEGGNNVICWLTLKYDFLNKTDF